MSEFTVIITPRWIIYAVGDIMAIPYVMGIHDIFTGALIKDDDDDKPYHIGAWHLNQLSGAFQMRSKLYIEHGCRWAREFYESIREWPCGIYRYADFKPGNMQDALVKCAWESVSDDINNMLY